MCRQACRPEIFGIQDSSPQVLLPSGFTPVSPSSLTLKASSTADRLAGSLGISDSSRPQPFHTFELIGHLDLSKLMIATIFLPNSNPCWARHVGASLRAFLLEPGEKEDGQSTGRMRRRRMWMALYVSLVDKGSLVTTYASLKAQGHPDVTGKVLHHLSQPSAQFASSPTRHLTFFQKRSSSCGILFSYHFSMITLCFPNALRLSHPILLEALVVPGHASSGVRPQHDASVLVSAPSWPQPTTHQPLRFPLRA